MKIIKRRDLIFIGVAIFLFLTTIGSILYSISFLAVNVGRVLNQGSAGTAPVVRFNIEGLKTLGISVAPSIGTTTATNTATTAPLILSPSGTSTR